MKQYYYIEPFVHYRKTKSIVLLYNTLNGEEIQFNNNERIDAFFSLLEENQNIIDIDDIVLNENEFEELLFQSREKLIGNTVKCECTKPFVFKPMTSFAANMGYQLYDPNSKIDNLLEIFIELNNECDETCMECKNSSLPSYYCNKGIHKVSTQISFDKIEKILPELNVCKLNSINIVGTDIFRYYELNNLFPLLSNSDNKVIFHTSIKNINNLELDFIRNDFEIRMYINPNISIDIIDNAIKQFYRKIKISFCFLIEDMNDYNYSCTIIEKFNLEDYQQIPFYNNENFNFFQENIFINKNELLESKPSLQDINIRTYSNSNFFGKIFVNKLGYCYSARFDQFLGSITNERMAEIVSNAFKIKESCWTYTREMLTPCKDCIYCLLCPSPSSFEKILGRNNLCSINEN